MRRLKGDLWRKIDREFKSDAAAAAAAVVQDNRRKDVENDGSESGEVRMTMFVANKSDTCGVHNGTLFKKNSRPRGRNAFEVTSPPMTQETWVRFQTVREQGVKRAETFY